MKVNYFHYLFLTIAKLLKKYKEVMNGNDFFHATKMLGVSMILWNYD